MTFREFMKENGYEVKTKFWEDFSLAERFGLSAIQYTFNRAFKEWKEDYEFLTELVLVLNRKIWQYHEKRPEFAEPYNTLWEQTCLLYTSPSPRDQRGSRMPSSA